MAKGKRGKKSTHSKPGVVYDSDDERRYEKDHVPDPNSSEYYNDAIDDFHDERDKILLDRGAVIGPADISSDEQEGVLDIQGSDSDSENEEIEGYEKTLRQINRLGYKKMDSDDDEEEREEDGLPDDKAWGKSRNQYYGGDVDANIDIGSDDDQAAAALEEKEALAIQQRLAQQLDEGDFGLDIFTAPEADDSEEKTEQKVEKDLSTLTKKEKMKLLKKESPELLELIEDYKSKMTELSERLVPIHKLIKSGAVPAQSSAARYVSTKVKLSLNYCVNISFYMMLKAKKTPVHNHPVIQRLLQYRNLLKQLESADEKIGPLIDETLEKINNGESVVSQSEDEEDPEVSFAPKRKREKKKRKSAELDENKKRLSDMLDEGSSDEESDSEDAPKEAKRRKDSSLTYAEKQALENYDNTKALRKKMKPESDDDEESEEEEGEQVEDRKMGQEGGGEEDEEKRPINYQIAKNKGLTAKKKKENRNPRVKHRMKYRKALIRRRGQVRPVRTETTRYSGEMSGIRSGIVGSRKLKS